MLVFVTENTAIVSRQLVRNEDALGGDLFYSTTKKAPACSITPNTQNFALPHGRASLNHKLLPARLTDAPCHHHKVMPL